MKKADLEKHLGKKISGRMHQEPHSHRYGSGSGQVADKREQRERDKAAGLVPFAVKLPQVLVTQLQGAATERSVQLNDLVAELLTRALSAGAEGAAGSAEAAKPRASRKGKSAA